MEQMAGRKHWRWKTGGRRGKTETQVALHGRLVIWGETERNRGKQWMFGKRKKKETKERKAEAVNQAAIKRKTFRKRDREGRGKNSRKSFWGEAARLHLSERAAHSVTCQNYPSRPWNFQPQLFSVVVWLYVHVHKYVDLNVRVCMGVRGPQLCEIWLWSLREKRSMSSVDLSRWLRRHQASAWL